MINDYFKAKAGEALGDERGLEADHKFMLNDVTIAFTKFETM